MSVIIRLQNLPWSANSLDIRGFFRGLSIPDGGVHIVGGEMGDAFIAFSTDEDARQAMMMDGGKIKEVGVRLLLSSRAEMQKVIETARQPTGPFVQLTQTLPQTPILPTQLPGLIAQQLYNHQLAFSSNNFKMHDNKSLLLDPMLKQAHIIDISSEDKYNKDIAGSRRDRQRDKYRGSQSSSRSRSSSRERSRDRKRSRSRERSRDRLRRDRSRSRERRGDRRRRDRKSWSRDRDNNDSEHSRSSDGRYSKKGNNINNAKPVKIWDVPVQTPSGLPNDVYNSNFPSGGSTFKPKVSSNTQPAFMSTSNMNLTMDDMKRLQNLKEKRNESAFQSFNNSSGSIDLTSDETNFCVQVSNLDLATGYGDVRRFFQGLPIPNNGIKMINDSSGRRTGRAVVQFIKPESRKMAVQKSGMPLNGSPLQVTLINDSEFVESVDSYRPTFNKSYENDSYDNYKKPPKFSIPDKEFSSLKIAELPTLTKEQDIMKIFSDYALMHIIVTKDRNKKLCGYVKFHRPEDAKKALNEKHSFTMSRKTIYSSVCDDFDFEQALKASTVLEETEVEYEERDDPRTTTNNVDTNQGGQQVSGGVQNQRKRSRFSRWGEPSSQEEQSAINVEQEPEKPTIVVPEDLSQVPPPISDPRLQNIRDPRLLMNSNNNSNRNMPPMSGGITQQTSIDEQEEQVEDAEEEDDESSDCVLVSNLNPSCTDMDVAKFFKNVGLIPTRVHILLQNDGLPSGDCFVEFNNLNEAESALNESEQFLGGNQIFIEPISRRQVNDVLSSFEANEQSPHSDNFNSNGKPNFRGPYGNPMNSQLLPYNNQQMHNQNRPYNQGRRPPPHLQQQQMMNETNILSLDNVPYRAGVEDIIAFFSDYQIRPQDVIRRYNDMGQPTGEAKVRFKNPGDAMNALEQMHMQKIIGRPVFLAPIPEGVSRASMLR